CMSHVNLSDGRLMTGSKCGDIDLRFADGPRNSTFIRCFTRQRYRRRHDILFWCAGPTQLPYRRGCLARTSHAGTGREHSARAREPVVTERHVTVTVLPRRCNPVRCDHAARTAGILLGSKRLRVDLELLQPSVDLHPRLAEGSRNLSNAASMPFEL